eukprot:jgi/Mesen1/8638/ME000500S08115
MAAIAKVMLLSALAALAFVAVSAADVSEAAAQSNSVKFSREIIYPEDLHYKPDIQYGPIATSGRKLLQWGYTPPQPACEWTRAAEWGYISQHITCPGGPNCYGTGCFGNSWLRQNTIGGNNRIMRIMRAVSELDGSLCASNTCGRD